MQNYSSLQEQHDLEEQGILFHVAEPTRSKWNHIEDLDSFFTRMYKYHQRHGFWCMLLQEIVDLQQYVFIIILTTYLIYGIDYDAMFGDYQKLTFKELILPPSQVYNNLSGLTCILLLTAVTVLGLKILNTAYHMIIYWDIKQFYNTALNIPDSELDNTTWSEIQTKIKLVQLEQQMCIHKKELNELDIYHRILRQENYFVAMVNKKLFPPKMYVPFFGEYIYWTKSLRFNLQVLLFWSPWAPFENPWHLREEYKRPNLRQELANNLKKHILLLVVLNLALAPLILLWQILLIFFSNADLIKREPGRLGLRTWSLYAQLFMRHFNELDHELHARLSRSCRPANKYLSSFRSPLLAITAQHIAFICGSLFIVLVIYTLIDDAVLKIEHSIAVMTFLAAAIPVCRGLIPDDTLVWCPETLLQAVVMHTHYLPTDWRGQAHTTRIRDNFQQLFQYRMVGILEEILSPLITPYVLIRYVYPRALDIVDFFRNFTVSVVGVGDVCSFAQLDIKKHGDPNWHETFPVEKTPTKNLQAEDGKLELSLVHFTTTNPDWDPPVEARFFVDRVEAESKSVYPGGDIELLVTSLQNILGSSSLHGLGKYYPAELRRNRLGFGSTAQSARRAPDPRKSVWMAESSISVQPQNMRTSAITLHDRRFQNQEKLRRSVEESTPLLDRFATSHTAEN